MYTNNVIYKFWLVRFSSIFSTQKHCQINIRICSHQVEQKKYSSIPNCLCQLMRKSNCLKIEVVSSILELGCIFQQPGERSYAEELSFCSIFWGRDEVGMKPCWPHDTETIMSLLWSLYLGVLPLICGDTSFVRCQCGSQHTTVQETVTTESSNDDIMSTVLIVLCV